MDDIERLRREPVGVRHVANNLVVPAPTEAARRLRRRIIHSGCQKLLYPHWVEKVDKETGEITLKSEFRLSICGREALGNDVRIYRNGSAVSTSGVARCGNVWACVVCAAKILRRRGDQIGALFRENAVGGSAVLVTFTTGHHLSDPLSELLPKQKNALRKMTQDRKYRELVAARSACVVATEITWSSDNGWHPHSHQAWFFPFRRCPDADFLASKLFPIWHSHCQSVGLTTIEFFGEKRVGVDVRESWDASEYLTKFDRERNWDLASEMTAGRLKTGRRQSSFTAWDLLEDAVIRGKDSRSAELWIEYARATKGLSCISLRGARDLLIQFGLPTNYDDWVDANAAGEGEIVATIDDKQYDLIIRNGQLGSLLEAARSGGLAGVARFLSENRKEKNVIT